MLSPYFNEDHNIFRKSVNDFVSKEIIPFANVWEKEESIPSNLWKKMGDLGFLGINYSEKYDGSQADFFYSVIFLEELCRSQIGGLTAAISVHQYMAIAHISKVGSNKLKEKYLTKAISGRSIGGLAITEPNTGSDVSAIETKAIKDGSHYIVNGSKTFITNGFYGDFITTAVKTGNGKSSESISLMVIDSNSEGFTKNKLNKMGWKSSDTAEINFNNVKVPVENLIGKENKGFYYIMESFQLERLVSAIISLSSSEYCLQETLKYLNERKAFNSRLSNFQTIRHTIANLSTEIESARQFVYYCSWLYDQNNVDVKLCSMAKLLTSELFKKVADNCLQFFGGYGYMEEYPISRIYRDARVGTIVAGTSEIMREIIAKSIFDNTKYHSEYKKI